MSARRLFALLLLAPTLGAPGCFSPVRRSTPETEIVSSGAYDVVEGLEVPEVDGAQGCGAQALATVLASLGRSADPAADAATLADELPWHDLGATPVDLLLEARRRGYDARVLAGTLAELADAVANERRVLLMLDVGVEVRTITMRIPSSKVMHWGVLSGIAYDGSNVLLAATEHRHHVVAREDLLKRWARSDHCMIIVDRASP